MYMYCGWCCCLLFVLVFGCLQSVKCENGVLTDEELVLRQKLEFIDAIGYGYADDVNIEELGTQDIPATSEGEVNVYTLTDEELSQRYKQEFVDALGYGYEDGAQQDKHTAADTDHPSEHNSNTKLRRRSADDTSDPFGAIAALSGGGVYHVDKANLSSGVDILSSVTLTSPVVIARRVILSPGFGQVIFNVDSSVTSLAINLQTSCCKPSAEILDPDNHKISTSDANVTVKVNITTFLTLEIGGPKSGVWLVHITDNTTQKYTLTVRGSSLVKFDMKHSDSGGNDVTGEPVPGSKTTYVKVSPFGGDHVSNWTNFVIMSTTGTIIPPKIPLGTAVGRTTKIFLIPVVWPNKDVYVGVEGITKDGGRFTRQLDTPVQPLGLRLAFTHPGKEFITDCTIPYSLAFTMSNKGPAAQFNLSIRSDNLHFKTSVSPTTIHLDSILPKSGTANVTIKGTTMPDEAASITITVIGPDGKSNYLQQDLIDKCLQSTTIYLTTTDNGYNSSTASSFSLMVVLAAILYHTL